MQRSLKSTNSGQVSRLEHLSRRLCILTRKIHLRLMEQFHHLRSRSTCPVGVGHNHLISQCKVGRHTGQCQGAGAGARHAAIIHQVCVSRRAAGLPLIAQCPHARRAHCERNRAAAQSALRNWLTVDDRDAQHGQNGRRTGDRAVVISYNHLIGQCIAGRHIGNRQNITLGSRNLAAIRKVRETSSRAVGRLPLINQRSRAAGDDGQLRGLTGSISTGLRLPAAVNGRGK